ncbi:MAG TPA: hypothetical protein VNZ22_18210, partial [Bacillota bacterium]|nr:hypothetical protein [Bacillota bacterium]
IAGIAGGALVAFKLLGAPNQIWLQLPVAVILSPALFALWMLLLRWVGLQRLQFAKATELLACLAASALWAPLVFVPVHYFTQGYFTSIGNLGALAAYQLPVNSLALFGLWALQKPRATPQPKTTPEGRPANAPPAS